LTFELINEYSQSSNVIGVFKLCPDRIAGTIIPIHNQSTASTGVCSSLENSQVFERKGILEKQ